MTRMLQENAFDKKVNRFIKDYTGIGDFGQARSFLLNRVYKTIPEARLTTDPNAVGTLIRWFFNPDGSTKDDGLIAQFRQILHAMKEKIPYKVEKVLHYLPEFEPQSFIKTYSHYLRDRNVVPASKSRKSVRTPNGYNIMRIDSFDDIRSKGYEWCIGQGEEWYDEFAGDTTTVYLVWHDGADDIRSCTHTVKDRSEDGSEFDVDPDEYFNGMSYTNALRDKNYGSYGSGRYPYDEYGLSKMVVIAYDNGMFEVFSRYNMNDGRDGNYLTKEQLSDLLGVDARQAFPYVDYFMRESSRRDGIALLGSIISDAVRRAIGKRWL